jgi:hypothetical protein
MYVPAISPAEKTVGYSCRVFLPAFDNPSNGPGSVQVLLTVRKNNAGQLDVSAEFLSELTGYPYPQGVVPKVCAGLVAAGLVL